jgi:predicted heme/steroid binding protein
MSKRRILLLAAVAMVAFLVVACGQKPPAVQDPNAPELNLTLEQLKEYNGQGGKPAYVAIEGIIYDVTNVRTWSGGRHQGFTAGQDLTDTLKNRSPHGIRVLSNLKVVGKLK